MRNPVTVITLGCLLTTGVGQDAPRLLGVCGPSGTSVACWDAKGNPNPDLTRRFDAVWKVSSVGLSYCYGRKIRFACLDFGTSQFDSWWKNAQKSEWKEDLGWDVHDRRKDPMEVYEVPTGLDRKVGSLTVVTSSEEDAGLMKAQIGATCTIRGQEYRFSALRRSGSRLPVWVMGIAVPAQNPLKAGESLVFTPLDAEGREIPSVDQFGSPRPEPPTRTQDIRRWDFRNAWHAIRTAKTEFGWIDDDMGNVPGIASGSGLFFNETERKFPRTNVNPELVAAYRVTIRKTIQHQFSDFAMDPRGIKPTKLSSVPPPEAKFLAPKVGPYALKAVLRIAEGQILGWERGGKPLDPQRIASLGALEEARLQHVAGKQPHFYLLEGPLPSVVTIEGASWIARFPYSHLQNGPLLLQVRTLPRQAPTAVTVSTQSGVTASWRPGNPSFLLGKTKISFVSAKEAPPEGGWGWNWTPDRRTWTITFRWDGPVPAWSTTPVARIEGKDGLGVRLVNGAGKPILPNANQLGQVSYGGYIATIGAGAGQEPAFYHLVPGVRDHEIQLTTNIDLQEIAQIDYGSIFRRETYQLVQQMRKQ